MIRRILLGSCAAAAMTFSIGCNSASTPATTPAAGAKKAEDNAAKMKAVAEAGKDAVKGGVEAGKDAVKGGVEAGKDAVKGGVEAVKGVADAAMTKVRDEAIKPVMDFMPKIEEKIKGMTGDAGKGAKEKFEALKKFVEDFKAAPGDKIKDMAEKLKTQFDELKKLVGL